MLRKLFLYIRRLFATVVFLGALWAIGFIVFVKELENQPTEANWAERLDGAVVLTGGGGRIGQGLQLLMENKAGRLLISGVHPTVRPHEIIPRTSSDAVRNAVDLEAVSTDTVGNAKQSALWVREQAFRSIYLVTADYHMPRALVLFKAEMPSLKVVAVPVETSLPLLGLMREYSKYLMVRVQMVLQIDP